MPRLSKDVCTRLIKYVKSVNVTYNACDQFAKSSKVFLVNIDIPRFKKSNPKLIIDSERKLMPATPEVDVKFVDGSELNFDGSLFTAEEMMGDLMSHAEDIDSEYESSGKSID
uniref:Ribosomal protein/NADH dehydrogenase domain-containing protein n=1 Tax=Corethron hystrix TaxID=216773 RepID=A0A7S1BHY7_9STRA|mmetsp:Transcript_28706/g.65580  ORF Transcript_28706/g.65580 Transcript_28706/m.65580 type:complete len:113 (+) Transcript_28706:67-405(+)